MTVGADAHISPKNTHIVPYLSIKIDTVNHPSAAL